MTRPQGNCPNCGHDTWVERDELLTIVVPDLTKERFVAKSGIAVRYYSCQNCRLVQLFNIPPDDVKAIRREANEP